MAISAREAAYRSLLRCERDGSYTNIEVDSKIKKYGLEGAERALYTVLTYGVTERKITLDFRLSALVTGEYAALAHEVTTLLRLGAYQILYLDRVPQSAAVNETVTLARRFAPKGSHTLVNAVLRRLCRTIDCPPALPDDPDLRQEIEYSVPRGLIRLWKQSYGDAQTETILDSLSRPAKVALRVNTLKTTVSDLRAALEADDVGSAPGDPSGSLVLDGSAVPAPVRQAIADGLCYVQDLSSQTAVAMLDPKPGETLIDTCCCPGGKSFAAALAMNDTGAIRAFDLHANKLSLVTNTADKLGITIIQASARDAREPDPDLIGRVDRVICDVPCSGLGVIAKKPEIRYRDLDSVSRLPALQLEILTASARYLKPGGRLLYSTCTLNRAENENVVSAFLERNHGFVLIEQRTFFPSPENDGFFAAVIEWNG